MPHHQRLLLGIEAGKHAPQTAGIVHAGQDRLNVLFIVQQRDDARPDLRNHLRVNPGRPLIHNQQRHEIFAHFAGNRPENRLFRGLRIQKFMRLFNRDDEMFRLIGGVLRGVIQFGLMHVEFMNAARDDAGDEQIGQHARFAAKLQHDMHAAIDALHHFRHNVLARSAHRHELEIGQAAQLAVERGKRFRVRP